MKNISVIYLFVSAKYISWRSACVIPSDNKAQILHFTSNSSTSEVFQLYCQIESRRLESNKYMVTQVYSRVELAKNILFSYKIASEYRVYAEVCHSRLFSLALTISHFKRVNFSPDCLFHPHSWKLFCILWWIKFE